MSDFGGGVGELRTVALHMANDLNDVGSLLSECINQLRGANREGMQIFEGSSRADVIGSIASIGSYADALEQMQAGLLGHENVLREYGSGL